MRRSFLNLALLLFSTLCSVTAAADYKDASRAGRNENRDSGAVRMAQATSLDSGAPTPGEIFKDCPDCPELVVIPAGEFSMGSTASPIEQPQRNVVIAKPFAIGRFEVTFSEWDNCFTAGACKYRPEDQGWGRGNRPVIDVSWDDAQTFVTWLSQKSGKRYRLPSEAEWEYSARGGTPNAYWWGTQIGSGRAKCEDCGGDSSRTTLPVGSFRPNAFGLHDTSGNAAEWVDDCWNDSYRGAPKHAASVTTGSCRQRVLRGGSFGNKSPALRSAARFRYDKDVRYYANGFRLVRELP